MSDPLTLLREYTIGNEPILEKDGKIIFGTLAWRKEAKTNFRISGWAKTHHDDWQYYTLECLMFYLKHQFVPHPIYCLEAEKAGVPAVKRPDRKSLFKYLTEDDAEFPESIDEEVIPESPITEDDHDQKKSSTKCKTDHEDEGPANRKRSRHGSNDEA